MHILFIGGLFQVRHGLAYGFARWEKSLLLLAAAAPFAFFFQEKEPLARINPLAAPVLLLSCMLGRPELRRFFGLSPERPPGRIEIDGAAGRH